jgi:hypothetical protein
VKIPTAITTGMAEAKEDTAEAAEFVIDPTPAWHVDKLQVVRAARQLRAATPSDAQAGQQVYPMQRAFQ